MNNRCRVCNDEFTTRYYRIYCSTKCQTEGKVGILVPEDKKYKYQLKDVNGKFWHYKY